MPAASVQRAKKRRKYSFADIVFQVVICMVFTAFTILCLYPFYYILINTISDNRLIDLGQVMFYPKGIHFQNYIDVFKLPDIQSAAVVSVLRTILGTLFTVLVTSYMAFLFTKDKMWGRKTWYRLTVATMYFNAGLIPVYLNINMLGLMNSFFVYIIPGLVSVYNMVLIKTYMESLPAEIEESAAIDGAGYFRRYLTIVLPLCTPILATVSLFTAVGHWNNFMDCLLYIQDRHLYTLQYILQMYFRQANQLAQQLASGIGGGEALASLTPTAVKLTTTVVVTLPILLVYPFVQRFFVKGIMVGAVKG